MEENWDGIFSLVITSLFVIGTITYSFIYIIKKKQFKNTAKHTLKILKDSYSYSLNFLTWLFLIVYYGEWAIKKLWMSSFSISSIYSMKIQGWPELIIQLSYWLIISTSLIIWTNKVLNRASKLIMEINLGDYIVNFIFRCLVFILFVAFQFIILSPMFTYGLRGTFGFTDF